MGRLRDMKDGWWRRTRSGGSGGGGGRGCQVDEMGSKVQKWSWDWEDVEEEDDKRTYKERKGGKEGE
jgi:hypothetical protein